MGAECCKCLSSNEDKVAETSRRDALHAGAKFMRNDSYFGISAKEIWVRLSNDTSALAWRTTGTGSWTSAEVGEVELTKDVAMVKSTGLQGLQLLDKEGKILFDLQAEDSIVRDQWVIALSELLQGWILAPETRPQVAGASGKSAREHELDNHFKNREAEFLKNREMKLAAREEAANARKSKYNQAAGGKTYSPLQVGAGK